MEEQKPRLSKNIRRLTLLSILFVLAALGIYWYAHRKKDNSAWQRKALAGKKVHTQATYLDSASIFRHLTAIASPALEGRETGSAGNTAAQQYILQQFDSLLLAPLGRDFRQRFDVRLNETVSAANLLALIPGTRFPRQYIVVSAHFDHIGKINGQVHPGADDNASGVAFILALAAYLKQNPPAHSVIIAAFDAEEKGLRGSAHFIKNSIIAADSIIFNLNLDMISRNDQNEIFACGTYHYPRFKKYIDSLQHLTSVNILTGHDRPDAGMGQNWTYLSDHGSFHEKQIPFIYFGVEDHADYHKPGDVVEKINRSFYLKVCNAIAGFFVMIDRQEKL
jgi:Peptidase family M28